MATGGGEVNSDEIIHIKCCFCVKNNRTREAVKYCVECKEYFCSPCTDTHQMFSSMMGHKLLDKADFRSTGSDGDLLSVPTQRCSQHPTEVLNMYCKDHDQVACPPCISLDHRTCKDILFIPEEVDQLYNRTKMTDLKQKLHKSKTAMQEMKAANENKLKELKNMFDKEVQSVKALRQELETLLDNLEQETIKELKTEFDRIEACLRSEINKADNLIDALDEVSSELKKSEGNKAQVFVSTKTAEKVTAKTDNVKTEQLRKTEKTVSFTADKNIKAFLQQHQALGKVLRKVVPSKSFLYKVKQRREIEVKLAGDRAVSTIKGFCIEDDGSLLLADHNMKKLKRLDISTETVKDYIDLQAQPYAVCLVSRSEAVVSQINQTVQFVSLKHKLSATHKLTMNHPCYGLAHTDGKLIISDKSQAVFIHDMNGQELKRISTDPLGERVFFKAANIKVSADGNRVFVADGKQGLVILDIQGNILTTLNDHSLARSWGVCTDGKNLFVLGHDSGNIVQIGQDYKSLGKLDRLSSFPNPYSLCFDSERCRLYVTLYGSTKITVLELE